MPLDDANASRDLTRETNPGYPAFQIARALAAATDADPQVRQNASAKIARWKNVLAGMLSGTLHIGSRKPMDGAPVWATPEVVTGGFATGALMAGGELLPHELELSARVAPGLPTAGRSVLNRYYLTENGLAELASLLDSGCYRVPTPEEGALLAIAWLLNIGQTSEAGDLLEEILPYFGLLRFYPQPAAEPLPLGRRLFLESIGQVRERLSRAQPSLQLLVQREAIGVWTPLYHRMIGLFLETVEGGYPSIQPDAEGRWADPLTGRYHTTGGWPCRTFSVDWQERAKLLLDDLTTARRKYRTNLKPQRTGEAFSRLGDLLKRCAADPASLSGRDVGSIRLILARHLTRHGEPQSDKALSGRKRQLQQITGPLHCELAAAVEKRLALHPAGGGLADTAPVLQPVTPDEEARTGLPAGSAIPAAVERKVRRCLLDTPEGLVERRIVTSGETLARVIPNFTAALRAQAFPDPRVARLYASIDLAFRNRRSLLLLNLESQVKLGELPWIRSIDRYRPANATNPALAAQALKELVILTLSSFPQAILPNQLLKDFRALVRTAELDLPLTEELAADIFMGDFAAGFSRAARLAAAGSVVEDSVYSRYYDLNCRELLRLVPEPAPAAAPGTIALQPVPRSPLVEICEQRARPDESAGFSVARNGMILEQAQILTTHNLAAFFEAFRLADDPAMNLPAMAEHCFRWICQRQQVPSPKPHARLIMLKNTAYAWRQMIFFLAATPASRVDDFLIWAGGHLSQQTPDFRFRFEPVFAGLQQAHAAGPGGKAPADILRFTGWSQGSHPLW